jgi:nucleotidyltransferase substrate binding protein (TIGR01987 family)
MKAKKIIADLAAAQERLIEALATPAENDLIRAGCIQYFEFCFELAWKSVKVCGVEQGLESCHSPKRCLKLAFSLGWIDDEEIWLEMLSARNRLSHTYDANYALKIYDSLPTFLPAFRELLEALEKEILE